MTERYSPVRTVKFIADKAVVALYLKERFLNEASGGSATFNMNTKTFSNIEILKPKDQILENFSALMTSHYNQILQNQKENKILTQLRDTLLPKLISGEVRVKDVQKTLSEVL